LAGISAALLGAYEVLLTDLGYALDNLRSNVDAALGQGLEQPSHVTERQLPSSTSSSSVAGSESAATVSVACLDWADASTYRFPTSPPQTPSLLQLLSQSQPQAENETQQSSSSSSSSSSPLPSLPHHQQQPHHDPQNGNNGNQWDMIIGADVVWLEELIPLLVQVS